MEIEHLIIYINLGYILCTSLFWCNNYLKDSCKKVQTYARFVLDMLVHAVVFPLNAMTEAVP